MDETRNRRLRLAIVIGSTREGRRGIHVGRWFAGVARQRPELDVDVIDLADLALPRRHPRVRGAEVEAFARRIDAADAFVIVTPEYNHSYPASLKHAIDMAKREWFAKPVGFVSYGGRAGGVLAVEHLRGVFAELHAVTMRDLVALQMIGRLLDEDGGLVRPDGPEMAAKSMLDQLEWWARTLKAGREARPYAA
ncbi:MAG: NAD(P)H-dependent oxidoreductase [Nitriliruptorales bacterium]|nr:NAD(P)H-dependent oxidoreductase [Nitriliruptorales bacterium]